MLDWLLTTKKPTAITAIGLMYLVVHTIHQQTERFPTFRSDKRLTATPVGFFVKAFFNNEKPFVFMLGVRCQLALLITVNIFVCQQEVYKGFFLHVQHLRTLTESDIYPTVNQLIKIILNLFLIIKLS